MEFLVESLKANRKASYADLKAKADEKKLKVFPIMFGRAQALLGIVKSAKRGQGKHARAKATARRVRAATSRGRGRGRQPDATSKSGKIRELLKTGISATEIAKKLKCTPALVYNVKARLGGMAGGKRRTPGRPPRTTSRSGSIDGLAAMLEMVKQSERERTQLRAALEKIGTVITATLA